MKGVQISTRCPSWQMVFLIISIFTVIIVPAVIVLHKKSTKHEVYGHYIKYLIAYKISSLCIGYCGSDMSLATLYDSVNSPAMLFLKVRRQDILMTLHRFGYETVILQISCHTYT
jgi:hypothetical protein